MRTLSLVVTLLLLWASPRSVFAQPTPATTIDAKLEARRYFQAGVAFQKTDDFQAASDAYATSLELYPTKSALFNLANCQRAMHLYADAWISLRRLHEQFGTELEEPMLSTSKTQLEDLENLTGLLVVETQPSGAELTLDGKPLGTAPLPNPVRVAIGQHTVQASLDGYAPKSSAFKLSPKQSLSVVLELTVAPPSAMQFEPDPSASTPPAPVTNTTTITALPADPDPPESSSAWTTVGWVGVAMGGVAVAAGARVGVLALDVDDHLSNVCSGGNCSEKYAGSVERLERLSLSANVFMGAGAALIATGVTLILLPASNSKKEELTVSVGPSALHIEGRF
jgi:PEGA domain